MQDDGVFNERLAARYDDDDEAFDDAVVGPAVELLSALAPGGRALEFGIGTGRIALPLARRGVSVSGVDLSTAMTARLRAKPGGGDIDVTIGDFAQVEVAGRFDLVYLVFNTVMNLTTQEAQVACFENAARHLEPGGRFVVEVMVPALRKLPIGETKLAFRLDEDHWGVDEYDVAHQRLVSHHIEIVDGRAERYAVPCRYVWPSELDLMARLARLDLAERWGGWRREPFTALSRSHVSVWAKPPRAV